MSRIIYFTQNASGGFQLSTDVLDTLQKELQDLIKAFICVVGNNVILCGVDGPSGGSIYTPGLIVWNNEFLYFEGGTFGQYLVINETTVQLNFCDGNAYDAYKVRTAVFQNTVVPEDEYIAVTNVPGLGIFTTIDTIANITTNVENNTNNIDNNYTNLVNQITNLTTIVNNNTLIDNSEIGDVKYIKNITNFDASGLGVVGSNREKWALVVDANVQWKNALGYTGTFAQIQGRGIVIAGTTYNVLDEFGVNDNTLVENNLPIHTHTFSGTTNTIGDHTHELKESQSGNGTADGAIDWRSYAFSTPPPNPRVDGESVQPAGSHSHTYSGTTSSFGAISPTAIDNRQPSIALYMAVKYQA